MVQAYCTDFTRAAAAAAAWHQRLNRNAKFSPKLLPRYTGTKSQSFVTEHHFLINPYR